MAEYVAGEDAALRGNALYAARLRDVVEAIEPARALAFNGKNTASLFYRGATHGLSYGRQSERMGATAVYVLPSTAATSAFWAVYSGLGGELSERASVRDTAEGGGARERVSM